MQHVSKIHLEKSADSPKTYFIDRLYMYIYNKIKSQWQFNSSSNEEQCSWLLMYATADLTAGEKEHDL